MFFIGIDIGKRNHEVALIDEKGTAVGKTLRSTNTQNGSTKLLNFFTKYQLTPENTMIGMEATGQFFYPSTLTFTASRRYSYIGYTTSCQDN